MYTTNESYLPSWELTVSPQKALLKMIFLFPRWDILVAWMVGLQHNFVCFVCCMFFLGGEGGVRATGVGSFNAAMFWVWMVLTMTLTMMGNRQMMIWKRERLVVESFCLDSSWITCCLFISSGYYSDRAVLTVDVYLYQVTFTPTHSQMSENVMRNVFPMEDCTI